LTEEVADHIVDGYEGAPLDERQKAALQWTDAVLDHPGSIPDEVRERLARVLEPSEVVEVTLALVLFHGLSRVLISLGLEPEVMPTTIVDTPGTRR
jgi:alkylhydroperoxidase family enzyme